MGYKGGTLRKSIVPSKVLALWATDTPQRGPIVAWSGKWRAQRAKNRPRKAFCG
jgi:hypothetical protein